MSLWGQSTSRRDPYYRFYSNLILSNNQKTSDKDLDKCSKKKFDPITMDTKQCPISLDNFKEGDDVLELPCGHYFLKENILNWLKTQKSTCPVCRFNLCSEQTNVRLQLDSIINHYSSILSERNEDAIDYFEVF